MKKNQMDFIRSLQKHNLEPFLVLSYLFLQKHCCILLQEQKRREMILARELKKPVEDMVLKDSKVKRQNVAVRQHFGKECLNTGTMYFNVFQCLIQILFSLCPKGFARVDAS